MLQRLWPLTEHELLSSLSTPSYARRLAQNAWCQMEKILVPSILTWPPHSLDPVVYKYVPENKLSSPYIFFFPSRRQGILLYPHTIPTLPFPWGISVERETEG